MGEITVYRGGPGTSSVFEIDENTVLNQKLMGEDRITMRRAYRSIQDIQIGDYTLLDGRRYNVNQLPNIEKISTRNFDHEIIFEAEQYDLAKIQYLDTDKSSSFYLHHNLNGFLTLILSNMNRIFSGWGTTSIIASYGNEYKNLHFENETCMQVLHRLALEYDAEFFVDNKTISFEDEIGSATGYSFSYADGLRKIGRKTETNKSLVTRVYGYGGDRNIGYNYRSGKRRLEFQVSGSTKNYLEKNTSTYGVIEHVFIDDNIYPNRTGTLTSVSGADNKVFADSTMDFNPKSYLIGNMRPKVHFQTGDLAGYEFELDNYLPTGKTFSILPYSDEWGYTYPNNTLKPMVGDKYKLVDLTMPSSYISAAEFLLQAKVQSYLDNNSDPVVAYPLVMDWKHLEDNSITLKVGDEITVPDTDFNINLSTRIIELKKILADPYNIEVSLSTHVHREVIQRIYQDQQKIKNNNRASGVGETYKDRWGWWIKRGPNNGRTYATNSGLPGHDTRIIIDGINNLLQFDENGSYVLKIASSVFGAIPGILMNDGAYYNFGTGYQVIQEKHYLAIDQDIGQYNLQILTESHINNDVMGITIQNETDVSSSYGIDRYGLKSYCRIIDASNDENVYGVYGYAITLGSGTCYGIYGESNTNGYSGFFKGGDFLVRLGDAAGAQEHKIQDSVSNDVHTINSDGICEGPSGDYKIKLGDNAAANKLYMYDSDDAQILSIDSNGVITAVNTILTSGMIIGTIGVTVNSGYYLNLEGIAGNSNIRYNASYMRLKVDGTEQLQLSSSKAIINNELEIDGDLNHDGTNAGFFGTAPVSQRLKADHNNWAAFTDVVDALVELGLFDQA